MPTPVGTGQITIIDILDGISVRLSNSAHTVPTTSDGLSGDFTGCASTVGVWLGQLDESANWSAIAVPSGGVTGNLVDKTYTVTDMTTNTGYVDFLISRAGYSSLTARFTITKVKQGLTGPVVVVTPSRSATFTATDGVLDPGQPIIDLTANVQNIASPAYVWTFLGFDTTPTASITNVQRIRASDLGDASGATVTCTVNGTYVDRVSIVRLEKSTASPGATVGGTWGENLTGQPPDSEIMNTQGNFQAARAWNFNDGLEAWYASGADLTPTLSYAVLDSTSNDPIFYSPGALAVYGPGSPKIRARIRRTSGSGWDGTVYYSTYTAPGYTGHGFDPGYKRVVPTFPVGNNVWTVIEWDMSSLDAGANDWTTRTILQIRLDLGSTVEDTFDIDWVAIGSVSPGSFGAPSGSPVGNSTADSVSDATTAVNDLTTGLNQRMRANADNILGGVLRADTVGVPVGLRVGSVSWDAVGNITGGAGLAITSKGIYGYNGTKATFAIDGTTGDATFYGQLSAASGSLGALFIATGGNIRSGQSAYNTGTGFYLGQEGGLPRFSIGTEGGASMLWDGTDLKINTPTFEAFSASIPAGNLSTSGAAGVFHYGSRAVSPSGGKPSHSYAWFLTGNPSCWITGATTSSINLYGTANGTTNAGTVVCLVKDSNGRVTFTSFDFSATHAFDPLGGE